MAICEILQICLKTGLMPFDRKCLNHWLYLLNQMRKQLHVFQAIILFHIQYAYPAWYGYASEEHIESIQNIY